MVTVTVEEMQKRLPELLNDIKRGEDVLITEDDLPLARLMPAIAPGFKVQNQPRQLGLARDEVLYVADDFDAPLDDFKDYM